MKLSKVALAMGLSMVMFAGFANAATSGTETPGEQETGQSLGGQGHGSVHFKGEIIDAPCSIAPASADQTVDLGQISSSALKNNGVSTPVSFDIQLQNCDIETYKTVSVVWSGTPDENAPEYWGITGTAAGASVVLRDASAKEIKLGEETAATTLTADNATIAMSAFLRGNGEDVVPGSFTSVADYVLNYQ